MGSAEKVISFDREKDRVSLGLKQLKPDPWIDAHKKFPIGAKARGKVANLTDYGAFVEIEEGVEGLIHVSELSDDYVTNPNDVVSIGQQLTARVLSVDLRRSRIALSCKSPRKQPNARNGTDRPQRPSQVTRADALANLERLFKK